MKIQNKLLFLACAVALARCSTYIPGVRDSGRDDQRTLAEKALFRTAPQSLAEVAVLNTGEVEVETGLLLDLDKIPGAKNRKLHVPVLSYLVRHKTKGDILIDTGFDASFTRSGHGNFGCMGVFFNFAKQKPGQDIAAQLKERGGDLKAVYFTHMHVDHTSGAPDLPKNIPYYAGKGTLADSYADIFGLCMKHLDGIENITEIDFAKAPRVENLGAVFDVFGDGSVWAIHTPGHSAGHMSFLVNTPSGPALITGDASHTGYGFKNNIAPGKMQNHAEGEATLARLRDFAARYPKMRVLYGHDTDGSIVP